MVASLAGFPLRCIVVVVLMLMPAFRPAVAGSLPGVIVEQKSRWTAATMTWGSPRMPGLFMRKPDSGTSFKTSEWFHHLASIPLLPAPINHLRIDFDCPDVVLDLLSPVNNVKILPSPSEDVFLTRTLIDRRFELTIRFEW